MKATDIKPISAWSAAFALAFRARVDSAGITQTDLAKDTARTQPWVSERLRAIRPVDTDMIDAAAKRMNMEARELVRQILRDMDMPTYDDGDYIEVEGDVID